MSVKVEDGGTQRRVQTLAEAGISDSDVVKRRVVVLDENAESDELDSIRIGSVAINIDGTFIFTCPRPSGVRPRIRLVVRFNGAAVASDRPVYSWEEGSRRVSVVVEGDDMAGAPSLSDRRRVTGRLLRWDGSTLDGTSPLALSVRVGVPRPSGVHLVEGGVASLSAGGEFSLSIPAVDDGISTSRLVLQVIHGDPAEVLAETKPAPNVGEAYHAVVKVAIRGAGGASEFWILRDEYEIDDDVDYSAWDSSTVRAVAGRLGLPPGNVYAYARAALVSEWLTSEQDAFGVVGPVVTAPQVEVHEILYGMFRCGVSADGNSVAMMSLADVKEKVQRSVGAHVISAEWADEGSTDTWLEDFMSSLHAFKGRGYQRVLERSLPTGVASVPDKIVQAVVTGRAGTATAWASIRDELVSDSWDEEDADAMVKASEFVLRLSASWRGHYPSLLAVVPEALTFDAVKPFILSRPVAELWSDLDAAEVPAPAGFADLRSWARELRKQVDEQDPDGSLYCTLASTASDESEDVKLVCERMFAAGVPFLRGDLTTALMDDGLDLWTGLSSAERDVARNRVLTLRRLGAIVPPFLRWDSVVVLEGLSEPADSAASVARRPRQVFVPEMAESLRARWASQQVFGGVGDPADPPEAVELSLQMAETIYNAAVQQRSEARFRLITKSAGRSSQGFPHIPPLEDASTSSNQSQCEYDGCDSIFSPSSYMYSLLEFLEESGTLVPLESTPWLGTSEAFVQRRSDLLDIKLDCRNSDVPVQAIDLVNELLEHRIVATALEVDPDLEVAGEPLVVQDLPTLSDGTPTERRAEPEHTQNRWAADGLLAESMYPRPFPMALADVECRLLLERESIRRSELMADQQSVADAPSGGSPSLSDLARAGLWLTPAEVALLVARLEDVELVSQWYGMDAEDVESRAELASLPRFMAATGLSLDEVEELLSCRTVNLGCLTNIRGRDGCDLAEMRLARDVSIQFGEPTYAGGTLSLSAGGIDSYAFSSEDGFVNVPVASLSASTASTASRFITVSSVGVLALSTTVEAGTRYVAAVHVVDGIASLDAAPRSDFFARAVRILILRRALGGSLLDVDRVVRAVVPESRFEAWTWVADDVVAIYNASKVMKKLSASGTDLYAAIRGSDTFARWNLKLAFASSPYERRFQSVAISSPVVGRLALVPGRGEVVGGGGLDDLETVGAFLAGARLRSADWEVLKALESGHPLALPDTDVTLANLRRAERASWLRRAWGRSMADCCTLMDIIGDVGAGDAAASLLAVLDAGEALLATGISPQAWALLCFHIQRPTDRKRADTFVKALAAVTARAAVVRDDVVRSAMDGLPQAYVIRTRADFASNLESLNVLLSPVFSGSTNSGTHPYIGLVYQRIVQAGVGDLDDVRRYFEEAADRWAGFVIPGDPPPSDWGDWIDVVRAMPSENDRCDAVLSVALQWWQLAQLSEIRRHEVLVDFKIDEVQPSAWTGAIVDQWVTLLGNEPVPAPFPADPARLVRAMLQAAAVPENYVLDGLDEAVGITTGVLAQATALSVDSVHQRAVILQAFFFELVRQRGISWLSTTVGASTIAGGWGEADLPEGAGTPLEEPAWRAHLADWSVDASSRVSLVAAIALAHATKKIVVEEFATHLGLSQEWIDAALLEMLDVRGPGVDVGDVGDAFYNAAAADFVAFSAVSGLELDEAGAAVPALGSLVDEGAASWAWQHADRIWKTQVVEASLGLGLPAWRAFRAWNDASATGEVLAGRQRWPSMEAWPAGVTDGHIDIPAVRVVGDDVLRLARVVALEKQLAREEDAAPAWAVTHAVATHGVEDIPEDLWVALGVGGEGLLAAVVAARIGAPLSNVEGLLGSSGLQVGGRAVCTLDGAIDTLGRVSRLHAAASTLGLPVDGLLYLRAAVVDQDIVAKVKRDLRQMYGDEAWHQAYVPLSDRMREQRRDAYLAWLETRHPMPEEGERASAAWLHGFLLTDVQVGAVMTTTRMVAAHSSVQLYVQRVRLGMEAADEGGELVRFSREDEVGWERMSRYRLWEASMKVLVYPENWIEPTYRSNKTAQYTEFERSLLPAGIGLDLFEAAFGTYVDSMTVLGHLDIVAMHAEREVLGEGESGGGRLKERALHLLGRSKASPYRWFYRRGDHVGGAYGIDNVTWSDWEELQVDVADSSPVVFVTDGKVVIGWVAFPDGKVFRTLQGPNKAPKDFRSRWRAVHVPPDVPNFAEMTSAAEMWAAFKDWEQDYLRSIEDAKAQAVKDELDFGKFPMHFKWLVRGPNGWPRTAKSLHVCDCVKSLLDSGVGVSVLIGGAGGSLGGDQGALVSFYERLPRTSGNEPPERRGLGSVRLDVAGGVCEVLDVVHQPPVRQVIGELSTIDNYYVSNDTYRFPFVVRGGSGEGVELLRFGFDDPDAYNLTRTGRYFAISDVASHVGDGVATWWVYQDHSRTMIIHRLPGLTARGVFAV